MKQNTFREHHILQILEQTDGLSFPLDAFLRDYFREHKAIGSKDRAEIANTIYGITRWKSLMNHLKIDPLQWQEFQPLKWIDDSSIPLHIRVSFPKELFDRIVNNYGEERAIELCLASNTPAPTFVRANALKIKREELLERWKNLYEVSPCLEANQGIVFHKKINFFGTDEFREGLFEVQDEGSQLLADLMQVEPGQLVLDFCSGSGGKTLAFAPKMQCSGQIYLHDIRRHILAEAKKRLKRAGIQNAQVIEAESPHLKKLKKKMDWVLVDAPCSGTGTLRRNPDMKWKYEDVMIERLVGQQRVIFEQALSYLKPDGKIVYGTCSLLREENQQQIEHFLKTYHLEVEGVAFKSYPENGGMDGFFGVVLKRRPE